MSEGASEQLTLDDDGDALAVLHAGVPLLRYVYRPTEPQLESPRPYFHPMRTLGGDVVTAYRPADHVWHKGVALSLPNVGPANFWGGTTYLRDPAGGSGYRQLPNNGAMVHREFEHRTAAAGRVDVGHRLDWHTEQGAHWFTERRGFAITVDPGTAAWTLAFTTSFTNISGQEIMIGSPTTQGRPDAGYGGLFWRGPRSFTGGRVYAPGGAGGDELMGVRGPWLAFHGRHDQPDGDRPWPDERRTSTLVFVDAAGNPGSPTRWFVRSTPFACVCPAPFFDTELPVRPGNTVTLRYAVVVADGDTGATGAGRLAGAATAAFLPGAGHNGRGRRRSAQHRVSSQGDGNE